MVITVNRETNHQDIDDMLLRMKPLKQFSSSMFLGKIKWGEDGLEYQKRIRNEWDQNCMRDKPIDRAIKQQHPIKLPDAIIAATAIYLDMPLLTFDRGFRNISNLKLIMLDL